LPDKTYHEPSVFLPENLLREARRQKNIKECPVPEICILDPDGDIVRYLKKKDAQLDECWACYHSELYKANYKDLSFGIIGCAVGASYAVLLAEQLFASGCNILISITSAGKLSASATADYILINETIRDEGTSYHYVQGSDTCQLSETLLEKLRPLTTDPGVSVQIGKSWTTDAPYRETASAIAHAQQAGAHAVEMEASALYAVAKARGYDIVCFAHLTNSMAQQHGDFEKGAENGSLSSLELIYRTVSIVRMSKI
jgi:purine-nucleoside phosphorylase